MILFNNCDLSHENSYTPFVLVDITILQNAKCKTSLKQ